MNYIYDVILNFNKDFLYEFFEWNKEDILVNIKRIQIFKIDDNDMFNIKNHTVKIEKEFLNNIYNKTEVFGNKNIEYACLFSSPNETIACMFNKSGEIIEKSNLLLEENDEILELYRNFKVCKYKITKINNNKNLNFYTRFEKDMIKVIKNELNKIEKENNIDKLKYIHYEYFNKIDTVTMMIKNLKEACNNFDDKLNDIYNILVLSTVKNKN